MTLDLSADQPPEDAAATADMPTMATLATLITVDAVPVRRAA